MELTLHERAQIILNRHLPKPQSTLKPEFCSLCGLILRPDPETGFGTGQPFAWIPCLHKKAVERA